MFGTLRLAALLVVCLVVVTTAAQARTTSVSVRVSDCTPASVAFVAKCFKVTTQPAAAISINLGTDVKNLVPKTDRSRLTHNVTVSGLAASTSYYGTITATPKSGKPTTLKLIPFTTASPGSTPAAITAQGNKLLLNGVSTLMFSVYIANCPDQATVATDRKMGFNLIAGHACVNPGDPQSSIQELQTNLGPTWWHEEWKPNESKLQSLPNLLPWTGAGPSPVFPALDPCKGDESKLVAWFGKMMSDIKAASGTKVVIPTIYAAKMLQDGVPNCLTPQWMDLFFWGAMAEHARGLVIDTHQPISAVPVPSYSLDSSLASTFTKELHWAGSFGQVAVGGSTANIPETAPLGVVTGIWRYGSSWYVVAVNPTNTTAPAGLKFPVTANPLAQGMYGTRNAKLKSGALQVSLAAKAFAVYKVSMK